MTARKSTPLLQLLGLPDITEEFLLGVRDRCALCGRERWDHRVTTRACPESRGRTPDGKWSPADVFEARIES